MRQLTGHAGGLKTTGSLCSLACVQLKLPGEITIHVPNIDLHADVLKDIPIVELEGLLFSCLNSTKWPTVC